MSQTFTEAPSLPGGLCSADRFRNIYFYYAKWICHSTVGSIIIASALASFQDMVVYFSSFCEVWIVLIEQRRKIQTLKYLICHFKCLFHSKWQVSKGFLYINFTLQHVIFCNSHIHHLKVEKPKLVLALEAHREPIPHIDWGGSSVRLLWQLIFSLQKWLLLVSAANIHPHSITVTHTQTQTLHTTFARALYKFLNPHSTKHH